MKVFLKIHGRFWTGHIGSFKDGSNIFFVTDPSINKAKDLGTEENALSQLEWWCAQCGADPKEWSLEIINDKPRRFCEQQKDKSAWKNPYGFYTVRSYLNADGEYETEVTWDNPLPYHTAPTGPYGSVGTLKYQADNSMPRTLTQICKDADKYYDNSIELHNLMEEVKGGDLSQSHYDYALEYINEKIESLKDKVRMRQTRNRFEED